MRSAARALQLYYPRRMNVFGTKLLDWTEPATYLRLQRAKLRQTQGVRPFIRVFIRHLVIYLALFGLLLVLYAPLRMTKGSPACEWIMLLALLGTSVVLAALFWVIEFWLPTRVRIMSKGPRVWLFINKGNAHQQIFFEQLYSYHIAAVTCGAVSAVEACLTLKDGRQITVGMPNEASAAQLAEVMRVRGVPDAAHVPPLPFSAEQLARMAERLEPQAGLHALRTMAGADETTRELRRRAALVKGAGHRGRALLAGLCAALATAPLCAYLSTVFLPVVLGIVLIPWIVAWAVRRFGAGHTRIFGLIAVGCGVAGCALAFVLWLGVVAHIPVTSVAGWRQALADQRMRKVFTELLPNMAFFILMTSLVVYKLARRPVPLELLQHSPAPTQAVV